MSTDLSSLDLGHLNAEEDKSLQEYFISSISFQKLIEKKRFIIIGRKGSGKTAFKRELDNIRKEQNKFTIVLDDSSNVSLIDLESTNKSEVKNKLKGYFVGLILNYILHSNLPEKQKTIFKSKGQYIRTIKNILGSIKLKPPFVEIAVKDIFPQKQKSELSRLISKDMISDIGKSLGKKDIWLLIDDIDAVFTGTDEDSSLMFIESLIYAASSLTNQSNKKIFIVLFVKFEIFSELLRTASEIDKEDDHYIDIEWEKKELENFLAQRICYGYNLEKGKSDWEYWKKLFDAKKKAEVDNIIEYLYEIIINGPRDLLKIIKRSQKIAISDGKSRISIEHIKEAESDYGESKLQEINRNFHRKYKDLDQIIDLLFRRRKQLETRNSLEKRINQNLLLDPQIRESFKSLYWLNITPFKFIKILYDVGFIGYYSEKGKGYIFYLEDPKPKIQNYQKLKIHNAFKIYLELK